jgi:hypothetical protein
MLPPEVLDIIIQYACTDGGRTGCALREVSRTFRDLVAPHRFRCVALYGARKINLFWNEIERAPANSKSARHLFVSHQESCLVPEVGTEQKSSLFKRAVRRLKKDKKEKPPRRLGLRDHAVLRRLCGLLSPSLYTLTVLLGPPTWALLDWSWLYEFPLLRSLRIGYFDFIYNSFPSITYQNIPKLEQMEISLGRNFAAAKDILRIFSAPPSPVWDPARRFGTLVLEGFACREMNDFAS